MPLLNHFIPPLSRTHPWRGFHSALPMNALQGWKKASMMDLRRTTDILIFSTVLIAGCAGQKITPPPVDSTANQFDGEINYADWASVTPKPFRVSSTIFLGCRPGSLTRAEEQFGPHLSPAIKVYANVAAFSAIKASGTGTLPVGSVVVKEKWDDEHGLSPTAYAAMIKRESGYNPTEGDWEYVYVRIAATREIHRGRLDGCIGCHRSVASRDYLFRTYLRFDK